MKYRIGRKQKRALLTADGSEVVVFNKGQEALAELVCRLLNEQRLNSSGIGSKQPCKWNGNLDACGNEVCWDLQECQGNPVACASGGEDTVTANGEHITVEKSANTKLNK